MSTKAEVRQRLAVTPQQLSEDSEFVAAGWKSLEVSQLMLDRYTELTTDQSVPPSSNALR
jgi:hypothetical protein